MLVNKRRQGNHFNVTKIRPRLPSHSYKIDFGGSRFSDRNSKNVPCIGSRTTGDGRPGTKLTIRATVHLIPIISEMTVLQQFNTVFQSTNFLCSRIIKPILATIVLTVIRSARADDMGWGEELPMGQRRVGVQKQRRLWFRETDYE